MTKRLNENIGHVECSECHQMAAVRRNKRGALYYDCLECGLRRPDRPEAQERLKARAHIWGDSGPPADIPRWIAENWPYAVAVHVQRKRGKDSHSDEAKGGAAQGVQAAARGQPPARATEAAPARKLPPAPPKKKPKQPPAPVKAPPNPQTRLPHVPKGNEGEQSWLDEL